MQSLHNDAAGFSLIEVLISLFLFSLLLISFNAMMLQMMKEVKSLYYYHFAIQQQLQFGEQLTVVKNNSARLKEWNQQNKSVLPHGFVQVKHSQNKTHIVLQWFKGNNACNKEFNKACLIMRVFL